MEISPRTDAFLRHRLLQLFCLLAAALTIVCLLTLVFGNLLFAHLISFGDSTAEFVTYLALISGFIISLHSYSLQGRQIQYLRTIRNHSETEETINYFATSLFHKNTEEEILWDITKNCIDRFGFVDCVIYLMNEEKTALVQKAAYGPKNPREFEIHAPIEIPLGKGIVGNVAVTAKADIIGDTSKDRRYIVDDAIRFSEIAVPMIYRGEVLGVIDSEHPEKDFFQPKHLNILRTVAALASNKIVAAKAEEERRKTEQIQRETEKLKEIDQLKSRFFANISHEFRTPLTLIKAPVDHAIQHPEKELSGEKLGMIRNNTDRLLRLVDQLLDLSKLDAGKLELTTAEGDVFAFLRALGSAFSSYAEQRNIGYRLCIPQSSLWASFDRDKLEKIVYNLLSNAFKFTPDGERITLDIQHRDSTLIIEVSDSGKGITAGDLPHIFNRFYRTNDPLAAESEGTGIGLALTKELVELMKGNISVKSEEKKGSCLTVTLPLAPLKGFGEQNEKYDLSPPVLSSGIRKSTAGNRDPATPPLKTGRKSTEPEESEKPLVLIVEDNADLRGFIRELLKDQYRILEAVDGREGLTTCLREIPDLVITDLMMPRIDGTALCRKIKTDERSSHIPVIMLTARAGQEHKIRGLETGADDYLTKPFDQQEMQVRVRNLILQRKQLHRKYSRQISIQPKEINITSLDEQFLYKVQELMEQNLSDCDFTISRMQESLALSKTQLHRKMKALIGQAPGEFLRKYRLQRAEQLLIQKGGNISDIAFSVGFNSLSYFTRSFKELFHQSPSKYLEAKHKQTPDR